MQALEMLSENYGGRVELARKYHGAFAKSLRKNFGGTGAIASMQHCNEFMLLGTEQISLGRVGKLLLDQCGHFLVFKVNVKRVT